MEVFIVRMWPEPGELRGRVEHVRSGRGEPFANAESLCAFLADALTDRTSANAMGDVALNPPGAAE